MSYQGKSIGVVKNIGAKKVNTEAVETLRDMLKKAESGDLVSVIFVDQYTDGGVGWGWYGCPTDSMLVKFETLRTRIYLDLQED